MAEASAAQAPFRVRREPRGPGARHAPGAELRFATDIDDYAGWAIARILRSPDFDWPARAATDWLEPWPDWPGTRYEAKATREGRPSSYLTFVRMRAAWPRHPEGPASP